MIMSIMEMFSLHSKDFFAEFFSKTFCYIMQTFSILLDDISHNVFFSRLGNLFFTISGWALPEVNCGSGGAQRGGTRDGDPPFFERKNPPSTNGRPTEKIHFGFYEMGDPKVLYCVNLQNSRHVWISSSDEK